MTREAGKALAALLAAALVVAGCNTVAGIGKDVKELDRSIRGSDEPEHTQQE